MFSQNIKIENDEKMEFLITVYLLKYSNQRLVLLVQDGYEANYFNHTKI